jgi:hypothetical protein
MTTLYTLACFFVSKEIMTSKEKKNVHSIWIGKLCVNLNTINLEQ